MPDKTISNLKRRLNKWELDHLRALSAELAERLEAAEDNAKRAWEAAESWREDAMRLMQDLMEDGQQLCMNKQGDISIDQDVQPKTFRHAQLIKLTASQVASIEYAFEQQKEFGGALIAQVWKDGMRVALITEAEQRSISTILGVPDPDRRYRSAEECHRVAEAREGKKPGKAAA